VSANSFSAAGPLSGYLWQLRRAFLLLLRSTFGDIVAIETDDDIVLVRGKALLLTQAKHSFGEGTLTAASSEWWRTLRVWARAVTTSPYVLGLTLTTTSSISADLQPLSAPHSKTDISALRQRLDDIAVAHGNADLATAYDAWLTLTPDSRTDLLAISNIEVNQTPLSALTDEVDTELKRCGFPPGPSLVLLRDRLYGWFQADVETNLTLNGHTVEYVRFNEQLTDLRMELFAQILPCVHTQSVVPTLDEERASDPTYLKQLSLLGAAEAELTLAVAMHHRATRERNHWLNERIPAGAMLAAYDGDLGNAWQQKRLQIEREASACAEVERGWRLFHACMEHRGAINGVAAPTHVANGTFHILANMPANNPSIGWHPRYSTCLQS
jgi:hypothetical protein